MIMTGLVSVTFRHLSPKEIINITKRSGLKAIEWGGDVHVPHGHIERAIEVRRLMEKEQLITSAYGSYFRVGVHPVEDFLPILKTAQALNAPTVRLWAGTKKSCEASSDDWNRILLDTKHIAHLARVYGIDLAFEYHNHTLTDTAQSALELIQRISEPNVYLYWQPPVGMPIVERIEGLKSVIPHLKHIHVFHWIGHNRLPLEEGYEEWQSFLSLIPKETDHFCSLEAVKENDINQFYKDAEVLKRLVLEINNR